MGGGSQWWPENEETGYQPELLKQGMATLLTKLLPNAVIVASYGEKIDGLRLMLEAEDQRRKS